MTYFPFYSNDFSAFQGFFIFDDWGDDCPLESVSRVNPFQFTDDTQILVLRSVYDYAKNRSHPCLWQFTAPYGYWLKILITKFSLQNSTVFTVKNSDEIVLNNQNLKLNMPYYIKDNYIKIDLSVNTNTSANPSDDDFNAYLSIVKAAADFIEANCTITAYFENNITTWSNFNQDSGYLSNSKCSIDHFIPPGKEIVVKKQKEFLEKNVDYINIYFDGTFTISPTRYTKLTEDDMIVLSSYDFNAEKHFLMEFTSDGSWESLGFEIEFEERGKRRFYSFW
uniref:CUB domain-containing protein n=1 Tax=Panagrolaimus sp. ES5 TaxID=591445 RepID=A0AC34FLI4_9BILA